MVKAEARDREIERLSSEISHLTSEILEIGKHDAERFDRLLDKHEEILDSRLGLHAREVHVTPQATPQPITRRKDFGRMRAEFEKQQRAAYWTKVIEETEAKDAKK